MQTVFTAHDTYIGVIGNEADLTVNGALAVTNGATGVYRFPDGTCSVREGENTSVVLNADGSVTIDTVEGRDISELLAIANNVESRMNAVEAEFDTVKQGFEEYTDVVDSIQSQFAGVLTGFSTLNANVSTYDARLIAAEASVANVLTAEAAQNAQLANFQTALNNETSARITQGVNFLSEVTRLDGKIDQEIASRTQLSSSISQTINNAFTTINTLSSSLASRVAKLEFASSSFSSSILNLSSSLQIETQARELLSTEFTSSFLSLESRLNREIIDREFSYNLLSGTVAASDNLLSGRITSLSGSVATDVNALRTRLTSVSGSVAIDINVLRNSFSTFTTTTNSTINSLQNSVSSLSGAVSNDISFLQSSLALQSGSIAQDINFLRSDLLALSSSVSAGYTVLSGLVTDVSSSVAYDINLLSTQLASKVEASTINALSSSISSDINELRLHGGGSSSTTSTAGLFAFNEVPQGVVDGVNSQFSLANTPNPPSSLMLFYNGQLMKVGTEADYILNGNIITFVGKKAPETDDILLATYFYRSPTKSYKFNEAVAFTHAGSTSHAVLEHVPDPPNSLMLFLNGQLLMQGGDYTLSGKDVSTDIPPDTDDTFLATYSHS